MPLHDAHNHLQHPSLAGCLPGIIDALGEVGLAAAAVNGTRVEDWPEVARLAAAYPWIAPQFGFHPWWVGERPGDWRERLVAQIEGDPSAGIGEAGLDRWVRGHDLDDQIEVLRFELDLAASLDRPVSLHCIRAWDPLVRLLSASRLPSRGFLIHACAAPPEISRRLLDLGASFSFPGSFLAERKADAREMFRQLPADHLLVETDAPSLPLPEDVMRWRLPRAARGVEGEAADSAPNHPANIEVTYERLAALRGESLEELVRICGENFRRLFTPRSEGAAQGDLPGVGWP